MYDKTFTVIGVLKKRGQDVTGMQLDDGVITSYNYINSFKNIEDDKMEFQDNTILLKPIKGYPVKDMKYEVKGALRAIRRISPGKGDTFSFNLLSNIQGQVESIFGMVNVAGFCIGLLSLLVGAFGIANIMFVIVKERTSQIGLKKAIGAKSSTILYEFLLESAFLCIIGGLVGLFLVWLLTVALGAILPFPIFIAPSIIILALSICVILGMISGIIPASIAAKMNPVEAIRTK